MTRDTRAFKQTRECDLERERSNESITKAAASRSRSHVGASRVNRSRKTVVHATILRDNSADHREFITRINRGIMVGLNALSSLDEGFRATKRIRARARARARPRITDCALARRLFIPPLLPSLVRSLYRAFWLWLSSGSSLPWQRFPSCSYTFVRTCLLRVAIESNRVDRLRLLRVVWYARRGAESSL